MRTFLQQMHLRKLKNWVGLTKLSLLCRSNEISSLMPEFDLTQNDDLNMEDEEENSDEGQYHQNVFSEW